MSQNIKILSVKLLKEGEKMVLGIKESDLVKSDGELTYHDPVHPDLVTSVHDLSVHLALRTSLIKQSQTGDTDELEKFKVTGYSIGGKEGQEGVTITGMRKNEDGQWYSLNAPFTRFEGTEENKYLLMGDLQKKIEKIETEVKAYLFEGKKKAPELFTTPKEKEQPQEGRVSHMQIAAPESQEERDEETLKNMRAKNLNAAVLGNADPAAMARVADMDNNDNAGEEVGELVEENRENLRGKKRGRPSKN